MNIIVLLFAFLSLCVHGTKRERDSQSESDNIIIEDEPNNAKKQAIASPEAMNLLNTPDLNFTHLKKYFAACPTEKILGDFIFLYNTFDSPTLRRNLAHILVNLPDALSMVQELAKYETVCLPDLFEFSAKSKKEEIFDFLVPIIHNNPVLLVETFHNLYEERGLDGILNQVCRTWIYRWSAIAYKKTFNVTYERPQVPSSAWDAVRYLLSVSKEREIRYFLKHFKSKPYHQILNDIIDSIIKDYAADDEYSIIAKMTFIELVNGVGFPRNRFQHPFFQDLALQQRAKADEYLAFLISSEINRKVMKIGVSALKYNAPFLLTVSAVAKVSSELLHYGAIEFLLNFERNLGLIEPPPFPFYDFSQVDPSYDNFRIFEIVLSKFQWLFYMKNLFLEDKWHTMGCVENIYRILKSIIPRVGQRLQMNGSRVRISSYYLEDEVFEIDHENDFENSEIDSMTQTVYYACEYILKHEAEPRKYLQKLVHDVAHYIPELFLSSKGDLKNVFMSYLKENGIAFMRNACRLKCIEAAIYTAKVSKSNAAAYLLEIYDRIPDMEFEVDLLVIDEENDYRVDKVPFYSTILSHLYKGTRYEHGMILVGSVDWKEGKVRLFKIAASLMIEALQSN